MEILVVYMCREFSYMMAKCEVGQELLTLLPELLGLIMDCLAVT